ncbi:MAG TPA: amidohydrolase family protein [Flavisolibacter sp.]|nr:amidohydrolase family protein [Flavisolibacter sp.]
MNKKLIRVYFRTGMKWRKFTADKIFTGREFIYNHVLVADQNGLIEDLVKKDDAGDDIETFKGIISPGLINCHCHLELSHMKGLIPVHTRLVDFVYKVVTERHHPEEQILHAISEAEKEMIDNGIVAVGDICNNTSTIHQKQAGKISYFNFIEASGWLPTVAQVRLQRAKELAQKFSNLNTPFSIVPHAPYSVSADLWQELKPHFSKKVITIHNQETACEDEFFKEGKGDFKRMYQLMKIDNAHHVATKKSSLQSYFHHLKNASSVILVHNTYTSQDDINFIKQTGTISKLYFCICINANQYIEDAIPPIDLFRTNNCSIVLGTDSLASNWSLSIMDEIKTILKHFPQVTLEEALKWATNNGAQALEMGKELGSFKKGKKPGVILIDEENLHVERLLSSA